VLLVRPVRPGRSDSSWAMHCAGRVVAPGANRLYSLVAALAYCDIRQEMAKMCCRKLQPVAAQTSRAFRNALKRRRQRHTHMLGGIGTVERPRSSEDPEAGQSVHRLPGILPLGHPEVETRL